MILNREYDLESAKNLEQAGCDPLLSRIFAARGIQTIAETQFSLNLLPHFSLFKNISEVATKICEAIISHKKIIIAADYDADGATSCAVALMFFKQLGVAVDFVVPDRQKDGYGLSRALVLQAKELAGQLIITVDNGISAIDSIDYALSLGIDVIVTDHHLPGELLPKCLIINPNQVDCRFPSKNLAGVGVIFYVLSAVRSRLDELNYFSVTEISCCERPNMAKLLDLVALGTVADVVPLDHVNRILVYQGLKRIQQDKMCQGIRALFTVAKRDAKTAQTFDLGFAIGPRINAAGRMTDMRKGINCLISEDSDTAVALALALDKLNQHRKSTETDMLEITEESLGVEFIAEQKSISVYSESFHEGVIGIVAGRLKEKYFRPVVVFALGENDEIKGSARSIPNFHIRDALDAIARENPGLIIKFGGHAMAAGLSLKKSDFERFKLAFENYAASKLEPQLLNKNYLTDGSLETSEMNIIQAKELNALIWGQGFPAPTFNDKFEIMQQRLVGSNKNHVKLVLKKDQEFFQAMIFSCRDILPDSVTLVYRLQENIYNGREELQLIIEHWEE